MDGVLVGRALLVAVGQVGDDVDLDSIGREEAHCDAARLHVLVAEVVDDATAVVGGAEHAAERTPPIAGWVFTAYAIHAGSVGSGAVAGCATPFVPAATPGPPKPSEPAPLTHS